MATSNTTTPFMGSVLFSGGASNVWTALSSVRTKLPKKCCFIQIQLDTTAGGSSLYIGDSDVSTTNHGAVLAAGQINQTLAFDSNLINLEDIWCLVTAQTELRVNFIVVVR